MEKQQTNIIHKGFKTENIKMEDYQSKFFNKHLVNATTMEKQVNEKALERAWKNRDFEIEMYWKRATYFWTFIGVSFVGYLTLASRTNIPYQLEFLFICLGFFLSIVWSLANKGSKFWQENWEYHIDMLEDQVTGPLYKTVAIGECYSVSQLNNLLNKFIISIWLALGIFYCYAHNLYVKSNEIDWVSWIILSVTFVFTIFAFTKKTKKESNKEGGFTIRTRFIKK